MIFKDLIFMNMKRLYNLLIFIFLFKINVTYSQVIPEEFIDSISLQTNWINGTHKINYNVNEFTICIKDNQLTSLRVPMFNDSVRKNMNNNVLNYIEEAYAYYLLNINDDKYKEFHFIKGSWANLNSINKEASFTLTNNNSQTYTATWNKKDSIIILTFPIRYDNINKGTRSEIENRYIDRLKHFIVKEPRHIPHANISELKQIEDSIYVLPGNSYIINSVSSDSYFMINKNTNQAKYIMDANNPIRTIANMIVIGNGFGGNLELKISKHEYGKSEVINIPLETFIQYNLANGCEIFWGLDNIDANILKGTIFCYNFNEGYDHIIRVEVNTSQLGSNKLTIKGYASLFVPTDNIQNLFQDKK